MHFAKELMQGLRAMQDWQPRKLKWSIHRLAAVMGPTMVFPLSGAVGIHSSVLETQFFVVG